MIAKAPEAFDRLLDELPVRQAPLDTLLLAGRAAKRRRRGAAVAGTAALLGVVVGGVAVSSNHFDRENARQPASSPSAPPVTPVRLPTSGYVEGAMSMDVGFVGILSLDSDGCVYLAATSNPSSPLYAVWPRGFTAEVGPDGLTLHNADGEQVAREGDTLVLGGAFGEHVPDGTTNTGCLPAGATIGVVQDYVHVRGGS